LTSIRPPVNERQRAAHVSQPRSLWKAANRWIGASSTAEKRNAGDCGRHCSGELN